MKITMSKVKMGGNICICITDIISIIYSQQIDEKYASFPI